MRNVDKIHDIQLFELYKKNIVIPSKGNFYYVNESNRRKVEPIVNDVISKCLDENRTVRWTGCMVSDVHRLLNKGGIFFYCGDSKNKNGKLRVTYEILPMSYIVEKSGGKSYSNIYEKVSALDLNISSDPHRKSPIFLCGKNEYEF